MLVSLSGELEDGSGEYITYIRYFLPRSHITCQIPCIPLRYFRNTAAPRQLQQKYPISQDSNLF